MPPPHAIDSAYNFVPLSAFVLEPQWDQLVSHDVPFRDGVSGRLKLMITAHTPILVAGERSKIGREHARFFQLPDRTFAVPGSALRSMIRKVVEIAAFGAMSFVDDRRLGVRDLTPGARPFYGTRLTRGSGRQTFEPLSQAGWLRFDPSGRWRLTPCDFARVEHVDLARYNTGFVVNGRQRPPAQKLYDDWQRAGGKLDVSMNVAPLSDHPHRRGAIRLRYRKASFASGPGTTTSNLVFTGQPGPNKHLEFSLHESTSTRPCRGQAPVGDGINGVGGGNQIAWLMNDEPQLPL